MAQPSQMLSFSQRKPRLMARASLVWMLVCVSLCSSGTASQPWSKESSVTRAKALNTTFMTTTNAAPCQVTSTGIPETYLSYDEIQPMVSTGVDTVNVASVIAIDTNRPNGGIQPTADKARPADPLSHITGDDASSKVRTIFFEIVGACIGVATLFVAVLALRRMPKRKPSDPESPPLERNHRQPLQHPGPGLTQDQGEPVELDTVGTAVEMQCEEPAIRNFNVTATQQPSGITAATG